MNSITVGLLVLYIAYITFGVISYYNNLDDLSAVFQDCFTVSPFTSNSVSLLSLLVYSPIASCLFLKRSPTSSLCSRTSTACSITLTTVLVYHSPFFARDTCFPPSLHYSLEQPRYCLCTRWFQLLFTTPTAPSACACMQSSYGSRPCACTPLRSQKPCERIFNGGLLYAATESWMAVVLTLTLVAWMFLIALLSLALRSNSSVPRAGTADPYKVAT